MAKRKTSTCQRVKVYRLGDDGKWNDQGTGYVTVDFLETSDESALYVFDEEDNETLLLHRISSEDIYRKQEDTIISWRDQEFSTELALSFQETAGCSYIWDQICNVQRSMQFSSLKSETFHSMTSELRELPAVEISTLPVILKTVAECSSADQLRITELLSNDHEFFRKLMDLFRVCEDLENMDGLHMIYKIVKEIVLLNSSLIFEKIFGDELIMDIIGALEYDPEVSNPQNHRNFLKQHVVFKEAIPIRDPLVLSKIHQTYRIGYLKDVVLARFLDDGTVGSLKSIIHSNNSSVVSLLKDDSTFIKELFARLRSPTISSESTKNLIHFLHEFCSSSMSLQMAQQMRLFRDLVSEGIFDIIANILQSSYKKLVLAGTEILLLFVNQDPNLLRAYIVRGEGVSLLGLLVKGMVTDFGDDMHCQFVEILRSLLDSYMLNGEQKENIIEIFYEKYLGQLIEVIVASCSSQSNGDQSGLAGNVKRVKPEILINICDVLCFCVFHHPYRIKCNIILNNVIDKVLLLTQRKERYLVVAAIRFVRTVLSRHDEHLLHHFIKNNLFKSIVDVFIGNGFRYNLLNSVVLELFEYIRKENMKILILYVVDTFWNDLEKFYELATFKALKVKYDQCLDDGETKIAASALDSRKRSDERALEKEEEDYFNEDSDQEESSLASASASSASHVQTVEAQASISNGVPASVSARSGRSGGLVDYDDDDDEDYKPPPKKPVESSEEDDVMEALRLKRKLPPKEREYPKRQNRSVFASLCSTLSQASGKKSFRN